MPSEDTAATTDAASAEYEAITFEVEDNVATITLNRPESLNSFNRRMGSDLTQAWETIRDTDDIHAVVLQANGERAFCTGVDIKSGDSSWFLKTNVWNSFDPGVILSPKFHHHVWKPVIVAVHGMCAGGAQYFLNEADIIICSDDAEFFDPHANGGIVSALEPIGMLARGVPIGDVLRWALMGTEERITAATALRIGLVTEVTPRAELRSRAREIALSIAERNPIAIQGTVRAIWESLDMSRTVALQNGMAYTHIGNVPQKGRPPRQNRKPSYR
jgi:enoyl-CoA hydratase/carnithine racemase